MAFWRKLNPTGAIGDFISGLFSSGKAIGGPVGPGIYPVAENRPEVLDVNGRSFLLMGSQRGSIDPNPRLGGGGTLNAPIYITVPGNTDRRTAAQIGAERDRSDIAHPHRHAEAAVRLHRRLNGNAQRLGELA